MFSADVIVAGGGVAGLLIASALASECSVLLIEQCDSFPRNKYWLTDGKAANENAHLQACIDRRYDFLDFIAYDGLRATITGSYCLWDTDKLIGQLARDVLDSGVRVLTGHRVYSFSQTPEGILVRANSQLIGARLLIDCMGFGSPLAKAKNTTRMMGYYILYGCEVGIKADARPVALDNVVVDRQPAFFELFPTSRGTAHAAIILPSRQYKPARAIKEEFNFITRKSHYSEHITWASPNPRRTYFGIVPVGRLYKRALDRILFFGEAGQANPATSATGLTRMLRTYRQLAISIADCLKRDRLSAKHLSRVVPAYMTPMNRVFQESLFDSVLSYDSNDFRCLVQDLIYYPNDLVNDLVFADFDFRGLGALQLALDALSRPRSVLGRNVAKSVLQFCARGLHLKGPGAGTS